MSRHPYRIRPWADPATRQSALLEIQKLIESGRYHVSADEVAEALLAEPGFGEPESSSCGGSNADAK
ncbi:MAG: flagellar biosynthesis anti-sigma factor FlgM [Acidimicrobiia bacterium]|nr:flagellar biosynthesis anti-sigma factor FlgM [Acidimicrobiia bacterium]MDH3397424.1 flagellar biosynthesis anti-sigma factor FlgM [Acidimicrobiia bacterium]